MVNNNAVSPVVGVMLMLVVTIIIAATVSAFSGGLMEDTKKAPNAQIRYVGVSSYVDNAATMAPGMVFEHVGGDTVDLTTLQLDLSYDDGTMAVCLVTYNDPPSRGYTQGYPDRERKDVRMEKFGAGLSATERKNPLLNAGERFIIYSDGHNRIPDLWEKQRILRYQADRQDPSVEPGYHGGNTYSSGQFLMTDGRTEYTLSDRDSGTILAHGFCYGETV